MNPRSCFIISAFLLLLTVSFSAQAQDQDCRKLESSVEIKDTANGEDGSITVTLKDATVSFTLHLTGKGRGTANTPSTELHKSTGTIRNIKPGSYQLIIHYEDATYCTETRKVTVN